MTTVSDKDGLCVRFRVRASLSAGKAAVHLSNRSDGSVIHPYDFYCGVWMGGTNPHLELQKLSGCADGTGESSLAMQLLRTDTDMFKIGVYVMDPLTNVVRHVASSFQTLEWLGQALAEASSFNGSKRSLLLKDNYSKNQVLLHFCNDATDTRALDAFSVRLRPSVLHENEEINHSVLAMSFGVHEFIEHSANVSSRNGGQNFVNPVCFTEAMGCVINYPLLNMTYSSERHRAPLAMLAYMGLSTMHYVNMPPDRLMGLCESEFVGRFVVPLCTAFTVCPKSSVYSGDMTIGEGGVLDCMTENFAMVLAAHLFVGLAKRSAYTDRFSGALAGMTLGELAVHFKSLGDSPDPNSQAHPTICDDCETLTGMTKSFEGSIFQHFLAAVAKCSVSAGEAGRHEVMLGRMMWDATRGMANVSAVPLQDFMALSMLLCKYGRLRQNEVNGVAPCAQIGLCIVSAKGPKFSTSNSELNGHACAVAQTLSSDGRASYVIAEGTSNMTMRDPPSGCLQSVVIPLTTGDRQFDIMDALGVVGESLGALVSTCGTTRVGEFIPYSFKGADPYVSCPFYMAGFFMGLEMNSCTPGVIPLDTKRDQNFVSAAAGVAGSHPVFGAPVVSMADESVRALPIDLAEAMGKEKAVRFLGQIRARNDETYIPRLPKEGVDKLMAPWGPLQPFDTAAANGHDPERTWISSCAEAFGDADVLRVVFEYKRRLAEKFNALQTGDAADDGIRMTVRCHMLSVVCHFHIPLPTQPKWQLSCARNVKAGLDGMPSLKKQTGLLASCRSRPEWGTLV